MAFPAGFDVKEALYLSAFVDAAYNGFGISHKSTPPNLKPIFALPDTNYTLIAWIQMTDIWVVTEPEFYGFVAKNNTGDHIVAFRGTSDVLEWMLNATCKLVPYPFADAAGQPVTDAGNVHTGFARIYGTIKVVSDDTTVTGAPVSDAALTGTFAEQVAEVIARHAAADSIEPATTRLVAHSLGGALITLYVIDYFEKKKLPPATVVYTFASPRLGDATFVAKYDGLDVPTWRIDNSQDLVPQVPPESWDYAHVDVAVPVDSTPYISWTPACAHLLPGYRAALTDTPITTGDCAVHTEDAIIAALKPVTA